MALQHRIRHFGATTSTSFRCDGCNTALSREQFDGHTLGCTKRKGINVSHRHNRVRGAIARTIREHGGEVVEEMSLSETQRMDIVVIDPRGKEVWVDLTVRTIGAKTTQDATIESIDERAIREKERHYSAAAAAQGAEFHALVFDVNAGYGPKAAQVLKHLAAITGTPVGALKEAASFNIQAANGKMLAAARAARRLDEISRSRLVPVTTLAGFNPAPPHPPPPPTAPVQ